MGEGLGTGPGGSTAMGFTGFLPGGLQGRREPRTRQTGVRGAVAGRTGEIPCVEGDSDFVVDSAGTKHAPALLNTQPGLAMGKHAGSAPGTGCSQLPGRQC